jgi:hypothetical protein
VRLAEEQGFIKVKKEKGLTLERILGLLMILSSVFSFKAKLILVKTWVIYICPLIMLLYSKTIYDDYRKIYIWKRLTAVK